MFGNWNRIKQVLPLRNTRLGYKCVPIHYILYSHTLNQLKASELCFLNGNSIVIVNVLLV